MKRLIPILIMMLLMLIGCGTQKKAMSTHQTDSVRTEIRYERIYVRDTADFEIPAQTAERTTQDSTSHLENDFAESDAKINPDGSLYHDLKTKPQKKPVPYDKPIEKKDSIIYREKKIEVPVPVEKELTWWQHTSIKWFPYTLGLILFAVAYIFRKPLFSLIRRFI